MMHLLLESVCTTYLHVYGQQTCPLAFKVEERLALEIWIYAGTWALFWSANAHPMHCKVENSADTSQPKTKVFYVRFEYSKWHLPYPPRLQNISLLTHSPSSGIVPSRRTWVYGHGRTLQRPHGGRLTPTQQVTLSLPPSWTLNFPKRSTRSFFFEKILHEDRLVPTHLHLQRGTYLPGRNGLSRGTVVTVATAEKDWTWSAIRVWSCAWKFGWICSACMHIEHEPAGSSMERSWTLAGMNVLI